MASGGMLRIVGYLVAGLWLLSLSLPAVGWGGGDLAPGYQVLVAGPAGFLAFQFGWLGNVLLILGLLVLASSLPRIGMSLLLAIGLLLSALSSSLYFLWFPAEQKFVYGMGFWVWLAALLLLAGALFSRAFYRRTNRTR